MRQEPPLGVGSPTGGHGVALGYVALVVIIAAIATMIGKWLCVTFPEGPLALLGL